MTASGGALIAGIAITGLVISALASILLGRLFGFGADCDPGDDSLGDLPNMPKSFKRSSHSAGDSHG